MSTVIEEVAPVIDIADLLRACAACLKTGTLLEEAPEDGLRLWWIEERARCAPLAERLCVDGCDWTEAIVAHRAHRHPFYGELAAAASVHDHAQLLLESWVLPPFLPLVERVFEAQTQTEGIETLLQKIHHEQIASPRATRMRQLTMAVQASAGDSVNLDLHGSLADRTLVFYHGYFCDPWSLAGALFATEVMAPHHVAMIGAGLTRLGFPAEDLQLIQAHSVIDEDRARGWMEVFEPALERKPLLREPLSFGIAACLETSARYLDDLSRRARARTRSG